MKKTIVLLLVTCSISAFANADVNKKISELKTSALAGNILGARALGLANKITFETSFRPNFNPTLIGSCEISGKSFLVDKGDGYGIMEINERDGGITLSVANFYHLPDYMEITCPNLTGDSTVGDLQNSLGDLAVVK